MRELFKCYVFFGSFFRPNSNVDISETVYSIDLKFEVRIVLDHVPFQIEFRVIRNTRVLYQATIDYCHVIKFIDKMLYNISRQCTVLIALRSVKN